MQEESPKRHGLGGAVRRWARALGAVAGWMATLRGVNKIYQEVSLEELSTAVRKTTESEGTAPESQQGCADTVPARSAGESAAGEGDPRRL